MKNFLSIFSFLSVSAFTLSAQAVVETYQFDGSHTNIYWHINHFGFSNPGGKFVDLDGTLTLDDATPQNSKVSITIPTAKIVTGIDKLDEHLKGNQFFNVGQFPTATFVSSKVDVTGKNSANVYGTLTLLGVAKPEMLSVTLNKIGENPISKKKTAGFTANTVLKRSDFGMTAYAPGLGDEVQISIEAEANLADAK